MRGYRAFTVSYGDGEFFLGAPTDHGYSQRRPFSLEYPALEATCDNGRHRAPKPDCGCGYNAFSEPAGATEYRRYGVMAEVWGYGRVDVYTHGFRARQLQIVAFFQPICSDCDAPATMSMRDPSRSSNGLYWMAPVNFYCAKHMPEDPMSIVFTVDAVIDALAAKYEVGVYDLETSKQTLKDYYIFARARSAAEDAKIAAEAAVRATKQAQEARKLSAKGAQMGMALS